MTKIEGYLEVTAENFETISQDYADMYKRLAEMEVQIAAIERHNANCKSTMRVMTLILNDGNFSINITTRNELYDFLRYVDKILTDYRIDSALNIVLGQKQGPFVYAPYEEFQPPPIMKAVAALNQPKKTARLPETENSALERLVRLGIGLLKKLLG